MKKTKKAKKPKKCANCEHAVFDQTWGECKCTVKCRTLYPGSIELISGCENYKENEGYIKDSKRVFGGM